MYPIGACAINFYGLPRSFRDYVLPSVITNVLRINQKYQCDYYIHYYNVTSEQTASTVHVAVPTTNTTTATTTTAITPDDVLLLRQAVVDVTATAAAAASLSSGLQQHNHQHPQPPHQIIEFVSDTDHEFEQARRGEIQEILFGGGGNDSGPQHTKNPYRSSEPSFTDRTLLNILKMWHSQDRVWNLMASYALNHNNKTTNTNKGEDTTPNDPANEDQQQQHPPPTPDQRRHNKQQDKIRRKYYRRVSMLRLDVIYTTPIDIYRVPYDPIPPDYNEQYLQGLRKIKQRNTNKNKVHYFYDYNNNPQDPDPHHHDKAADTETNTRSSSTTTPRGGGVPQSHCVVPGFKSFPVNDRYFTGPYEAVQIWAQDRFRRARHHVHEVLPQLQRDKEEQQQRRSVQTTNVHETTTMTDTNYAERDRNLTDFGLHDEKFVAYTLLPAIRTLITTNVTVHVDRALYFVRIRQDGAMWLRDKPGYGRVPKTVLEAALGRTCAGYDPYEVDDPILGAKSPGRWQMKCPPPSLSE